MALRSRFQQHCGQSSSGTELGPMITKDCESQQQRAQTCSSTQLTLTCSSTGFPCIPLPIPVSNLHYIDAVRTYSPLGQALATSVPVPCAEAGLLGASMLQCLPGCPPETAPRECRLESLFARFGRLERCSSLAPPLEPVATAS